MTVSSILNRKEYVGNGATTAFATSPVVFFEEGDLDVYVVVTATGVAVLQTLTTHYTVTGGAGLTGTVTMLTAPAATETLVIVRTLDITQETDFVQNDPSDAEAAEDTIDRLTMICQQLYARLVRAFTFADSDVSGASAELPTPVASTIIGWNSSATALQNYLAGDIGPTTPVSVFMATVLDDTTAAAARTTLDVLSNAEVLLRAGKNIYGLTYSNNAGDITNDIDIAAGGAMDATNAYFMAGTAKTKQSDAAWAVGNGGMLDTGAVGNSDYYLWIIARPDTGVVDYLSSLSSTAPTMPANYTYKRLIGWFKRVAGVIVLFHTYEIMGGGLAFSWDTPTLDVNLSNTLTTSRRTDAAKVPLGFSVTALLDVFLQDASASNNWIGNPDQTDVAPVTIANSNFNAAAGIATIIEREVRTSAAGLVAARSSIATIDTYSFATKGFHWGRRN